MQVQKINIDFYLAESEQELGGMREISLILKQWSSTTRYLKQASIEKGKGLRPTPRFKSETRQI